MSARRGVFVTGTDTGVGKTVLARALVRALRARGIDAGAMKPIETGVAAEGPLDALALREAAGGRDPLDDVCPERFALPAAPSAAARAEGRRVDMTRIDAAFARLAARHEWLVVEGAGGLLVPIDDGIAMAELAARLMLPLVVVARASLGTINHTRLTLEAARARDLSVRGLVINRRGPPLSSADEANLAELRRDAGLPILAEVPDLARGAELDSAALDLTPLLTP